MQDPKETSEEVHQIRHDKVLTQERIHEQNTYLELPKINEEFQNQNFQGEVTSTKYEDLLMQDGSPDEEFSEELNSIKSENLNIQYREFGEDFNSINSKKVEIIEELRNEGFYVAIDHTKQAKPLTKDESDRIKLAILEDRVEMAQLRERNKKLEIELENLKERLRTIENDCNKSTDSIEMLQLWEWGLVCNYLKKLISLKEY